MSRVYWVLHAGAGITMALLVIAAVFAIDLVAAAGGKNQWSNPLFGEDQCAVMLPAGIDLDTCEVIPSAEPSLQHYRCDTSLTVYCPDDGSQPPGQSK